MTVEDHFLKTIRVLETCIIELLHSVKQPIRDDTPPRWGWRFANEGVAEAVLLKGVRIISALNSLVWLLRGGYVQEMGVICRTIDEFFVDIIFLLEGFPDKELTAPQRQFLEDFYQEEFDQPESPLESTQRRKTVRRQKIHAAVGRIMEDVVDPQQAQEMFRTLSQAFSGYVHGAYQHIMELYGGDPPRFHLDGMLDTPRIRAFEEYMEHNIYRGIQALMVIAIAFKREHVFTELLRIRTKFEQHTGYKPKNSLKEKLRLRGAAKEKAKKT